MEKEIERMKTFILHIHVILINKFTNVLKTLYSLGIDMNIIQVEKYILN